MRQLKCYQGNLDGSREGLVVATSWNAVSRIVHSSVSSLKEYWGVQPTVPEWATPNTLYTRPMWGCRFQHETIWREGRCPLIKQERT